MILAAGAVVGLMSASAAANGLTPMEELGKNLLFDSALSTPPVQSCATCHAPETGFTGPDSAINELQAVYPGAVFKRFGKIVACVDVHQRKRDFPRVKRQSRLPAS